MPKKHPLARPNLTWDQAKQIPGFERLVHGQKRASDWNRADGAGVPWDIIGPVIHDLWRNRHRKAWPQLELMLATVESLYLRTLTGAPDARRDWEVLTALLKPGEGAARGDPPESPGGVSVEAL